MVFTAITAIVVAVLVFAYRRLAELYGQAVLLRLTAITLVFFFVKELLQKHRLLVHHFYSVNRAQWVSILGVPPFVVLGHLFIVLMTWQLAVLTMHRLKLGAHPAVLVTLVWNFTSGFSMLMENTGIVGRWWVWQMPSWWWFPTFMGVPLRDLPMERPIVEVWGYFISTFWFMVLLTDLPGRWTAPRAAVLVLGLAAFLDGSRSTSTNTWIAVERFLPFVSVALPAAWHPRGRRLFVPTDSVLLRRPGPRQQAAVLAGLLAMCVVCSAQLGTRSKWSDLVSLIPVVSFAAGAFRRWPVSIDVVLSGALLVVGDRLHDGNLMLAADLVFRLSVLLVLLVTFARWREGAGAGGRASAIVAVDAETAAP